MFFPPARRFHMFDYWEIKSIGTGRRNEVDMYFVSHLCPPSLFGGASATQHGQVDSLPAHEYLNELRLNPNLAVLSCLVWEMSRSECKLWVIQGRLIETSLKGSSHCGPPPLVSGSALSPASHSTISRLVVSSERYWEHAQLGVDLEISWIPPRL